MLHILAITTPIYLLMACGWVAGQLGAFTLADCRVLGRYVVNLALPALLFQALTQRPLGEVLDLRYLLAYGGAAIALQIGWTWWLHRRRGVPLSFAALQALGMCQSNSGFVGYGVASLALGPVAATALALNLIIENLLVMPIALALADSGLGSTRRFVSAAGAALRGLARHPLIIAIVAGLAFGLSGLSLPEPLARTLGLVAGSASPVALFVIGGSLVGLNMRGMAGGVVRVTLGKLLVHPLAALVFAAVLLGDRPDLRSAAVLYACMPMLSIYPVLAQKYDHEGFCAAALMTATLASFVTLNLALALLRWMPGWMP